MSTSADSGVYEDSPQGLPQIYSWLWLGHAGKYVYVTLSLSVSPCHTHRHTHTQQHSHSLSRSLSRRVSCFCSWRGTSQLICSTCPMCSTITWVGMCSQYVDCALSYVDSQHVCDALNYRVSWCVFFIWTSWCVFFIWTSCDWEGFLYVGVLVGCRCPTICPSLSFYSRKARTSAGKLV